MKETEIGNRGSKSDIISVKEQRVDGSFCFPMQIKCTLVGCENSYLIKIPSKQLKQKFSTSTSNYKNNSNLNP
jgi:hypothetical protein